MDDIGSALLCFISGFVVLIIITVPFYLLWRKHRRNELAKEAADDERAARLGSEEEEKLATSRANRQTRTILVWVLIGCAFFMLIFARPIYAMVNSPQDVTLEQLHAMANPTASWRDYRINARNIINTGVQYSQSRKGGGRDYFTYFIIQQGGRYLVVDSNGNPDHLQVPVVGRLDDMSDGVRGQLAAFLPNDETVLPYVLKAWNENDFFNLLFFIALGAVIVFIIFILISNRLDILQSALNIAGNTLDRLDVRKLFH